MDFILDKEGARAFIDAARQTQRESGKSPPRRICLNRDTLLAISEAAAEMFERKQKIDSVPLREIAERLLQKFEEICRCQGNSLSVNQRRDVLSLLTEELLINHRALGGRARKLLSLTVLWGAIGPKLLDDFPLFAATPGILRDIVFNHSTNPHDFLSTVQENMTALAREEEFADFADMPSIFRLISIHHPSDPRGFLRKVQVKAAALAEEEEFADLADTMPAVLRYAAIHNAADPEGFLRRTQRTIAAIEQEEEFVQFTDTPGIIRYAVAYHPSNPRAYLRRVSALAKKLMQEPEFADLAKNMPGLLLQAACKNPATAHNFLRKMSAMAKKLAQEPEFADLADRPSIFWFAASHKPNDPYGLLRTVQKNVADLKKEEEFAGFTTATLRRAAVQSPLNPRRILRKWRTIIDTLTHESEFADYPAYMLREATIFHSDPRRYLRKAHKTAALETVEC